MSTDLREPLAHRAAERSARLLERYRWLVLALWVLGLAVAAVVARPLPGLLSGGGWYVSGSQSEQAAELVREGFEGRGATTVTVVLRDERHTVDEPEFAQRADAVVEELAARPDLAVTGTYGWTTLSPENRAPFVGDDGRTVVDVLALDLPDGEARQVLPEVQAELETAHGEEGLQVSLVSPASFWGEVNVLSEEGLVTAELVTLPLILLILLLLYRSVVASVVSLVVAVTAILLASAVLALLAREVELSVFTRSAVTMLGLGVGVDYALFMISRFTAELRGGAAGPRALVTTLRTSGESVLSSALVVVMAMSTLLLVPLGVVRSIALGAMLVVALAALASVVVLPVLLLLLGRRIEWLRVPLPRWRRGGDDGPWARMIAGTMRRPWPVLIVSLGLLVALSLPALQLRIFTADARIVPTSSPVRQGYDVLVDQFGVGAPSPMVVVADAEQGLDGPATEALGSLAARLEALPGVARVESPLDLLAAVSRDSPAAALDPAVRSGLPPDARATLDRYVDTDARRLVLEVVPEDYAASESARGLLDLVRAEAAATAAGTDGLDVVVGGETAEGVDSNAAITTWLPRVLALMLAVIAFMLVVTFRSLLLPLKAIAMNIVSATAAFGVLVLVFQQGMGAGLLGAEPSTHLQNIVPVLLLALLFSLSTDYEIFLLSRVREEWLATGDNTQSVVRGITRTGPLISGAAMLMVAVFGAFALTSILPIQQLGLGLAIAIAIDATIIRMLVVPASMRLLGDWNWWLPGRGHPRVGRHPAPRAAGAGDVVVPTQPRPDETTVVRP